MGPVESELRTWASDFPELLPTNWPFDDGVSAQTVLVCFGAYVSLGFGPVIAMAPEHVPDVLSEAIEAAEALGL